MTLLFPPKPVTTRQKFAFRAVLPVRQTSFWKIETGIVRTLTWQEDGTVVALGIWGAGALVGGPLVKTDPYQIECLTPVEAVDLQVTDWSQFTDTLLQQWHCSEELMVIRSYRKTDLMLIKLLGWLAGRFGSAVDQGQLIDLRLTHQDLAELLSTTRVTITRTLSQLEQQGFIYRRSLGRIVLREEEFWHYEI